MKASAALMVFLFSGQALAGHTLVCAGKRILYKDHQENFCGQPPPDGDFSRCHEHNYVLVVDGRMMNRPQSVVHLSERVILEQQERTSVFKAVATVHGIHDEVVCRDTMIPDPPSAPPMNF